MSIHACPDCDGDGFILQTCGCREAMCPHAMFGDATDEREGLYGKFWVRRTDGTSCVGGKHEHCEYFVLDWGHDPFAIPAALAYASACEATHPELAADLRKFAAKAGAK